MDERRALSSSLSALPALSRMAARNVRKHWRHSAGSILSIAVGFVAIALFSGYLDDLTWRQSQMLAKKNMLGDVIIEHADAAARAHRDDFWGRQLWDEEQAFIDSFVTQQRAGVVARARFLDVSGLASTQKSGAVFFGVGFDVAEGAALRGELVDHATAGRALAVDKEDEVLLAEGLGAALDCAAASGAGAGKPQVTCRRARAQLTATTKSGQLNVVEPRTVGFIKAGLKELDARLLMMPLPLAQRLLHTTAVSRYTVLLAPDADARAFAKRLEHAAAERGLSLRAMRWIDHSSGEVYRRGMDLLGMFRAFVVVIVVAIAAMSVWMTMMRAVSERTREVGMLRSLGFLRRHVVALFLFEAGYLALASCVVGAVASAVLIALCNRSGISYKAGILTDSIPLAVATVPSVWLAAVVGLSALAMCAALVPARHAARMPIPDALGHV